MESDASKWTAQGPCFAKISNKKGNSHEYTYARMASINQTVENYPSFQA